MSEEISVEDIPMERRLHTRHRARTEVFIRNGDTRTRCKAENLSASGVAIRTDNLGLKVGTVVELAFVINLGAVAKIHRRSATVRYVRNGVTGFHMKPYEGR
jgi:hypothetical protein